MTVLSDYIARMVSYGVPPDEALEMVTELFAAGAANVVAKSANAKRQQRYRDRQKTVTNRNETVTQRNAETDTKTVTKRNDVTVRYDASLYIDKNRKKERRGTAIPDDWKPDEGRWTAACQKLGAQAADLELGKFSSHHRAKGTVFKNWNFAWDKWMLNAGQWAQLRAPPIGVVNHATVEWRPILESYKRFGTWPKGHGNDPTSPACRAPPELLREFGYREALQ